MFNSSDSTNVFNLAWLLWVMTSITFLCNVLLVEQDMFTLLEHLMSFPCFVGVLIASALGFFFALHLVFLIFSLNLLSISLCLLYYVWRLSFFSCFQVLAMYWILPYSNCSFICASRFFLLISINNLLSVLAQMGASEDMGTQFHYRNFMWEFILSGYTSPNVHVSHFSVCAPFIVCWHIILHLFKHMLGAFV